MMSRKFLRQAGRPPGTTKAPVVWRSLRRWLVAEEITQKEFASSIGVNIQTVSCWIYGHKPPLRKNVQKCAEVLAGEDQSRAREIFEELAKDAPIRREWPIPEAEERSRKLFFL